MLKFFLPLLTVISIAFTSYAQDTECYSNSSDKYDLVVCFAHGELDKAVEREGFEWTLTEPSKTYAAVTYRNISKRGTPVCVIFFREYNSLDTVAHEAAHCASVYSDEELRAETAGNITADLFELFYSTDRVLYSFIITKDGERVPIRLL